MADRQATVVWEGDLPSGRGAASLESSGLAGNLPVSWASRTEAPNGQTSPEELLAASHASCFSMALSKQLMDRGATPQRLETSATVSFTPEEGVTRSALFVAITADGIDAEDLNAAAQAARDGCPISKALAGNVEITVEVRPG